MSESEQVKTKYHHGDLANALIEASLKNAREGGPTAITLRDAARQVGVSAPAAYRHFANRDELVARVAREASQLLGRSMLDARRAAPIDALERFRAVGHAYIRFAIDQAGLLETAFATGLDRELTDNLDRIEPTEPSPFGVLIDCLDQLESEGRIAPSRRDGAEIVAWASVHGLAMLFNTSPPDNESAELTAARVLNGVQHALGIKDDESQ